MAEHALSTDVHSSDPLQDAAEAMGSAMQSVREGASGALPAVGRFVSRVVYSSSYALSYGIVFPLMVVVRAIPKDNAMVHGLVDGALAARERVESWGGDLAENHAQGSETDEIDQTENGKPSEPKTRRRSGTRRRTSHRSARSSHKK
jgi:hypothetical protein